MSDNAHQDNIWYVYILQCADNTLYTGITTNIKRRLNQHNESKQGAKYTRARRPNSLVYQHTYPDRSTASKEELRIKSLNRSQKMQLINISKNTP